MSDGVRRNARRWVWQRVWPKVAAIALGLAGWELVVLSGWRPRYVLPGPLEVLHALATSIASGDAVQAASITMARAVFGYAIALIVGTMLGLVLARIRVLRIAMGSLLSGVQSMPSVAWFPLAILLFQLSESAIISVVVLGAAPSIANGLLSSIDHVPPVLVRAGRVLGAKGFALYRLVYVPAALPGFVSGLKQGWAFAWRSLMAGELLVIIGQRPSLGVRLQYAREFSDAIGLVAWMLIVLAIGIIVDSVVFGAIEYVVRSRRGLTEAR